MMRTAHSSTIGVDRDPLDRDPRDRDTWTETHWTEILQTETPRQRPPKGTWDQTARREVKLDYVVFLIFQVLSNRVYERVQNPFSNDNIGSRALRWEFTL